MTEQRPRWWWSRDRRRRYAERLRAEEEARAIPACNACAWHKVEELGAPWCEGGPADEDLCVCPAVLNADPRATTNIHRDVIRGAGGEDFIECEYARERSDLCGPAGRFWQAGLPEIPRPRWWWTGGMRRRADVRYEAEKRDRARMAAAATSAREGSEDAGIASAAGFAVGLATGIPVPLSAGAVLGASLHAMSHGAEASTPAAPAPAVETFDAPKPEAPAPSSPSYDPGPSYSSPPYDSGGSSGSYGGGGSGE